jgi:hypothetical protein
MPLDIPPAPAQSIDALRAVVPLLAQGPLLERVAPRLSVTVSRPGAASNVSPAQSYKVYSLSLSDLAAAAAKGFRTAQLSGWRHILVSPQEVVSADVFSTDSTGGYQFASLSADPSAAAVQSEVAALARDPALAGARYEVALLQVPALAVTSIWLRDASGKAGDILVPVAPVRSELVAGRRYSSAAFADALKDVAAKILAAVMAGRSVES